MIWFALALAAPRVELTVETPETLVRGATVIDVALWREAEPDLPTPTFDVPRPAGALAIQSSSNPPPEQRTVEGVDWLIQHRKLQVYPLVDGQVEIPAFVVWWRDAEGKPQGAVSKPLSLQASYPPGIVDGMVWMVGTRATIQDSIHEQDRATVGVAFTRAVTVQVDGVDAALIPDLLVSEVAGARAYPEPAVRQTTTERGVIKATRTDQVTYVPERLGRVTLPPVSFWLYTPQGWTAVESDGWSKRARLNPALGIEAAGSPERTITLLGILGLFGAALWVLIRRAQQARAAWRKRGGRTAEEQIAWRALRDSLRHDDSTKTLQALYAWLDIRHEGVGTLRRLITAEPSLQGPVQALEDAALAQKAFPGDSLLPGLKRVRAVPPLRPELPALNPQGIAR